MNGKSGDLWCAWTESTFWFLSPGPGGPGDRVVRIVVENGYLAIPDKPGCYEMDEEPFKPMPPKPWHRAFSFALDGASFYLTTG